MPPRTADTSSERCLLEALIAAPPGGLTRAELQERTGLSPATLVTHLKKPEPAKPEPEKGESEKTESNSHAGRLFNLVEINEDDEARGGRYRLKADVAFILAIDLGRSEVRVGIGNALGDVLRHPTSGQRWEIQETVNVDAEPWDAMDRAAEMAASITEEAEELRIATRNRFAGIGISVTAAIEPDSGMFRPGRLVDAWEGLRVVTEIRHRLELRGLTCPLVLDKDSNHCATAFSRSPQGLNVRDFVFIKWSHGLSAGLVLGGRLQRGVSGSAGAFGHSPIVRLLHDDDSDSPAMRVEDREDVHGEDSGESPPSTVWPPEPHIRCRRCDKSDCLEAMIGANRLRRVVAEKHGLDGEDESRWPTLADIQRIALEDRESQECLVMRAAAKRLGNTLGTITNLLNPQLIVIGGLFGREHAELLNDRIRRGLRDVSTTPAYRDVDVQFTDLRIIDGVIASVITSGRLASFLLSR